MYISNFKKFINYFGGGRKLKLIIFTVMSIFAGLFEFLGVALVYPFIMMIISPETISNIALNYNLDIFAKNSGPGLALIVGAAALALFIFKNLYIILFLYIQNKFVAKWTQSINNKFMQYFLYAPYKSILKISNRSKLYIINTLSRQTTGNFVFRVLSLITNLSIVILILGLLFVKFPIAGSVSLCFSVICLFLQNIFLKKKVNLLGKEYMQISQEINSISYSTVNNIKDIKIFCAEKDFYDEYGFIGAKFSDKTCWTIFYSGIPPYLIEVIIVFVMLLGGAVIAYRQLENSSVMIASFAMIVAAIFRIAPALNRIQSALMNLPAGLNFVKELNAAYENYGLSDFNFKICDCGSAMQFHDKIVFHDISFSYENGNEVLHKINFEINKGEFIGIIGGSGAGKSTLADIFTGILMPDSGEVVVDNTKLTPYNHPSFRQNIGYVQQDLNVLEKSFRENIAWGIPVDEIDDNRVKYLIKQVQLGEVIDKYENGIYAVPFVGENGLSRGQKQRLAIARALYRNPEILIFDEATSALDVKIEAEITDMLLNICSDKTIIAIAHRLSTLKSCDKLIYLREGQLIDIGSFKELSEKYTDFAELVRLSCISE